MLLDEPTAGMTFSETEATGRLIKRISAETGMSLIIIEHDISFIRQLDCPIVVMLKGKPVCRGSYEEIRNDPLVRAAYLGTHG
jgi:ABC-type branched-subunit amino acid transport system ATPase component